MWHELGSILFSKLDKEASSSFQRIVSAVFSATSLDIFKVIKLLCKKVKKKEQQNNVPALTVSVKRRTV
jgi:hypothetical protein